MKETTTEILARIEQYIGCSDLVQVVTKEQYEEIKLLSGGLGYGLVQWLTPTTALWPHTLLIGGTFLAHTVRFVIR